MYFPVMDHHLLTRVGTQMTNLRTPDAPPIVMRSRESREKDLMKRFDIIIPFIFTNVTEVTGSLSLI